MRIAFVVQRYGTEILGGAELHCRWVAERLAERHRVEVLTTTAVDYLTWENVLPPGASELNGVVVRRFLVERPRRAERFAPVASKVCFEEHSGVEEERWLLEQGPVTPGLLQHLGRHQQLYDALVFFSYRCWTTYQGLRVAPAKSLLVPTAEHDRALYLRLFRPLFRWPALILFNTPEERILIERITGQPELPGEVVGAGVGRPAVIPEDEVAPRLDLLGDYLVYVGRLGAERGCALLVDHFLRYQRETRAQLTLALVGRGNLEFAENVHLQQLGALEEGEKLAAIARARALLMPARHASLSLVVLEAWMLGRPVLVNGDCEVLRGQTLRAGGGLYYRGYEEFAAALELLRTQPALADGLGRQGRAYFEANHSWDIVMGKYERLLERVAGTGARP